MDGAKLVPKPPKPGTSGNAQAFTVEGHPAIKEVQYHSGGGRHDAETISLRTKMELKSE